MEPDELQGADGRAARHRVTPFEARVDDLLFLASLAGLVAMPLVATLL